MNLPRLLVLSVLPAAAAASARAITAGEGGLPIAEARPFVQNPAVLDLPEEAVGRARRIVRESGGTPSRPEFECVPDFLSPFDLAGFASKGDRVFVVRVGGYDLKGASGAGNRFVWINGRGDGVWEP